MSRVKNSDSARTRVASCRDDDPVENRDVAAPRSHEPEFRAPPENRKAESTDAVTPVDRLLAIMRRLRGPDGCPWDRKQTLDSLRTYLVEECYEEIEAVDSGDVDRIREELGDVLLQVVFQAAICEEKGWFSFHDVAAAISDKLVRRHPHVFGDVRVSSADEVLQRWDALKRKENGAGEGDEPARSAVDGIPKELPALQRADRVQARASRAGFDWQDAAPVWDKLDEEIGELKTALGSGSDSAVREEFGDVLFTLVNLSRFLSLDAELALRETTEKFIRRFRHVERHFQHRGRSLSACSLDELDAVWNDAKAR